MPILTLEGIVENGQIRLRDQVTLPEHTKVYVVIPEVETVPQAHVYSPRLVHPDCSRVGQDIFVPVHRMLSLRRAIAGDYSGAHIHDGTLYRSAIVPILSFALTGPALGIAKAALDDFGARLPGRVVAFTAQEKQLEMPTTHLQVAKLP